MDAGRLGSSFAHAMATKDADALLATLADPIDFRAMTPNTFWESSSADEVVHKIILGHWLEAGDEPHGLDAIEVGEVGDRTRIGYRFRVTNADGTFVVEQQAYIGATDGRIDWLRIMCAGFLRLDG